MENDLKKKVHFLMAQKRMEQIRDFYGHLIIYITVNSLFFAFWFFLEEAMPKTFWEPAFLCMAGGAGVVVLAHGLLVFGPKFILPKGWEERKMKKLIDKMNNKNGHAKYQ